MNNNVKLLFTILFLGLIPCGCEKNPSSPAEVHIDADGFVLEDKSGKEVYRELEGAITGAISLDIGDTLELSVHFLDHDGNDIDHAEDENPEEEEESLQVSGNDDSIAIVEVKNHEEVGDEHEEEEQGLAILIIGKSVGSTSFKLELMHESHADYTSGDISVTIVQ